jgi:hypothetical protein
MEKQRPRQKAEKSTLTLFISLLVLLIIFVIVIVGWLLWRLPGISTNDCNLRNTTAPIVPIYPSSELREQRQIISSSELEILTYVYEASASPDEIRDFYFSHDCKEPSSQSESIVCVGKGELFGDYEVWQLEEKLSESVTNYSITVRWDKCPPGIFER